jgi:hypothetical protein
LAAGLATFALLSGVAKMQKRSLPAGFPGDPEAAVPKYDLAFRQLEETYQQHIQEDGQLPWSGTTRPSIVLSDGAFASYKKPDSVHKKPGTPMQHAKETKSKSQQSKTGAKQEPKQTQSKPKDPKSKDSKRK